MRTAAEKVTALPELLPRVERVRATGGRLGLTNGCFDLLHTGHLYLLEAARREVDTLVVGVNRDSSVRRLKGAGRPLVPENDRALLVAALEAVDWVVLFAEATAEELVRRLRPHVYVKGGDYTVAMLPEAAACREVGARIHLVPYQPGRSTTALVDQIRRRGRVDPQG